MKSIVHFPSKFCLAKYYLLLFIFSCSMVQTFATNRSWTGVANSDFNNLLNWSPVGVPGSSDTATIALTGNATITLSASVTIERLNITMSANTRTGILDVGAYTLTITGTTTIDVLSGNANSFILVGVNGGTSAGVVDFGGTVSAGLTTSGKAGFIGNSNSQLIFRSDLTIGTNGYVEETNVPGTTLFDALTSQTVTYNNTGAASANFNNITVGSTNNPAVTLAGAATAGNSNLIGNLTINGTSAVDFGTRTWNRTAAGGTLSLNSTATMKLAGSTGGQTGSNFPSNFSTMTLATGSTVEYNSAGGVAQTVYAGATYGNLTLSQGSGSGGTTKSATAAITVAGNFLINANATFSASTFTHSMQGHWTNNGTFTQGTSTINLNGSSNQDVGGSSANTFNNLTINNAAGITLTANATVNATHTFTSGIVTTGSNKLIIATGGTVSRTSGHVNGFLQKNVATGATSRTFEVGGASVYAPINVSFGSVTTAGDLTAKSTDGDHADIANSGIDATKSVNRNWSMTNSGIVFTTYSATFNFDAGDVDGGASTSNFNVRKLDGGVWSPTTVGTQAATSTQATGMTSFSDYQVGEPSNLSVTCPANFSVSNDAGTCGATVSYTGGQAATSTSIPAPVITYAPPGPFAVGSITTVTATATNINGSVNCTFDVTVTDDEDPVINSCPSNIDVCGFVATWTSPTAADNCAVATLTGDYTSGDTFPLGITTVTYTATDVNGNTSTCQFTVTTHDAPTANANIDQTGCHSGTFTLAGSIGGEATSSTWTTSGDGTFDDATLLNAVYTPGATDSINGTATLTLTTDDPAGSCTAASDPMDITFNYVPPRPDPVTGPGPATACNGDVFSYTTSSPGALSYTWTSIVPGSASVTGGQGTSTATITFGVLPVGTSYYPFRVTGDNTCGSSAFQTFSIQNVVGVPIFSPGLPTLLCSGTTGIVYSVIPMPGASTYTWTVPTGATITGGAGTSSITVDFSPTFVSGNISVSASNACMTSAVRRLFVAATPGLPGIITGTSAVCPGSTLAYSISAVPNAASYNWLVPAGATINSGQGTTSISVTFPTTFVSGNVSVAAVSACVPPTTSTYRHRNVLSPVPKIPASISGATYGVCGITTSYTAAAVSGATSYFWTVPAGCTLIGQGSQTVSVGFPSSGFSSGDICVSSVTSSCTSPNDKSQPRCMTVKAFPSNPGVITGPSAVCPGNSYGFNVTNVAGLTYNWTVPSGSVITSGAGTSTINVLWGNNVGYMNVNAANACGVSNTSIKLITLATCRIAGQQEPLQTDQDFLDAYPNPTFDKVMIQFACSNTSSYKLNFFDITGREVMNVNGKTIEGNNLLDIDLSSLKAGIYIAALKLADQTRQIRIVKE